MPTFKFSVQKGNTHEATVSVSAPDILKAAQTLDERAKLGIIDWKPIERKMSATDLTITKVTETDLGTEYSKFSVQMTNSRGALQDRMTIWARDEDHAKLLCNKAMDTLYAKDDPKKLKAGLATRLS